MSQLGVWHGVEARFRLLNPVARETWVRGSLRVDGQRRCAFRYAASGGACLTATKKSGSAGRQFVVSIEGLEHYRARIFRPLSNKAGGRKEVKTC